MSQSGPMPKAELREGMLQNVGLLRELYKSSGRLEARQIITTSSDVFTIVLLNILYRVAKVRFHCRENGSVIRL